MISGDTSHDGHVIYIQYRARGLEAMLVMVVAAPLREIARESDNRLTIAGHPSASRINLWK